MLDLGLLYAFVHAGHNILADDGVGGEAGLHIRHKALFEVQQIKHIAHLHQHVKFILRHDLAELAVARSAFHGLVIPGLLDGSQLGRGQVADVCLVGAVVEHIFIGTKVRRELYEVLGVWVYDTLCGLGRTVVDHHIRRVRQNIAGSLDNTIHSFYTIHLFNL